MLSHFIFEDEEPKKQLGPSTRKEDVSRRYGGIDKDILDIFLNLDAEKMKTLLEDYKNEYGMGAGYYARKTYKKWQSGEVRPSGQTLERLIETLPSLLDFETKCELLKKLRSGIRRKESYELNLSSSDWMDKVFPYVSNIINKSYKLELPKMVQERLEWLSDGDVQLARRILAQAEAQESRNAVELLEKEFEHIEILLRELPPSGKVKYVVELPQGKIRLNFTRSKYMDKEERGLIRKPNTESLFRPTAEELLDNSLENLDEAQARALSKMAAEESVRIAAQKKVSEVKYENARKDIERFIEDANMLDKASGVRDYKMSGTFEGASGTTNIQVSRQRSKTAIVIAVVVGLILIIYFLSR